MSSEVSACAEFIYATLSADAIIGGAVYPDLAPVGTPRPYVVYSLQGGADTNALGGNRAATRPRFQVKAVGAGDGYGSVSDWAGRIDTLLAGARAPWPAATPVVHITVIREAEVRYSELKDNTRYNHQGGLYGFTCQPIANQPAQ